jgi:hypothetical protein
MGTYNSILARIACPICGNTREKEIQYKHGSLRQYKYHIGDRIEPPADREQTARIEEQVDGITECSVCQTRALKCIVTFRRDVIVGVTILPALWPGPPAATSEKRPRRHKRRH